jgi:signal transduction histidine kinase
VIVSAAKLRSRVIAWQALFSIGTCALVAVLVPRLLLLSEPVQVAATRSLLLAVGMGGLVALGYNALLLRRHRFVLRALALGSRAVEANEMQELSENSWRVTTGWLAPPFAMLALSGTLFRPALIDLTTGVSIALLGTVFVAAASLPLSVLVRGAFLKAIELCPFDVMREVLEAEDKTREPRQRLPRRLLLAVALPVAFVALGTALVTNAHVRRADERQREETALTLARSALEPADGLVPTAGRLDAMDAASRLGFRALVSKPTHEYQLTRTADGVVELTTPLDAGTARVRFEGSTVGVFSPASLLLTLFAVAVAAFLGALLGRALSEDLFVATRGVRLLGTESVISGGTRVMRPVRFTLVEDLGRAIENLAERFRVFARAQERAIAARERAARMRGMFFASVSHDLKSPLNAILGFTELVRQGETLGAGQLESLNLIERRGRELLALIETVLDAARVEAGQLQLVREPVTVSDLFGACIAKARDLGGDRYVEVVAEIAEGVPVISVDQLRVGRALATLVGHAIRSSEKSYVRMRAAPSRAGGVRMDIEVPSTRLSGRQLERMLDPSREPGSEHRGLALGLSLARAIFELHGGGVVVTDRGTKGSVFTVRIPSGPLRS